MARTAPVSGATSTLSGPIAEWPTYSHDLQRTGANLEESTIAVGNASALAPLWTFNTTGVVSGSLAVVNGTAYFGAWDGDLYAVNADTGTLDWKVALPGHADYTGCHEPGIAATPAVWNNTVYIGGGNPSLYAVNAQNGSIEWTLDLANVSGSSTPWTAEKIWSSAALYDGSIYLGVASGCDSPLVRGALFQIGLRDHMVDHAFFTLPAGEIGPGIWSSPSVDPTSNTVWVTTGNEGSFETTYARSVVELNASNVSQVLGFAQRAVPFEDLDFGEGATLFQSSGGTPMVVAVNKNGIAYAFNDSALRPNGASPDAWTVTLTPDSGTSFVPPAYDGHYLYFGSVATTLPNGTAVVGSVRCVYPDNGTTRWIVGVSSGVYGGLTYADGTVVVGLTGGEVEILDAATGAPVFSAAMNYVWGEPVVVNGELLVPMGALASWNGGGAVEAFAMPVVARPTATIVAGSSETAYAFHASVAGGVTPYEIAWTFGDGTTGSGGSVGHSYTSAGYYNATVNVTDATGRTSSASLTVRANDPQSVVLSLRPDRVNLGESTWVNATVRGGAAPFTYVWQGLPPGAPTLPPAAPDVVVTPRGEGKFDLSLLVNGSLGQSTVANATLWVDGPTELTIVASPSDGVPPLTVSFRLLAEYAITSGTYEWQFGDGGTSTSPSPVHTYPEEGQYPVQVTVLYPGGTLANASIGVIVVAGPTGAAPGGGAGPEIGPALGLAAIGLLAAVAVAVWYERRRRPPTTPEPSLG